MTAPYPVWKRNLRAIDCGERQISDKVNVLRRPYSEGKTLPPTVVMFYTDIFNEPAF